MLLILSIFNIARGINLGKIIPSSILGNSKKFLIFGIHYQQGATIGAS